MAGRNTGVKNLNLFGETQNLVYLHS